MIPEVQWYSTLDFGVDCGLDSVLNNGLNIGLQFWFPELCIQLTGLIDIVIPNYIWAIHC